MISNGSQFLASETNLPFSNAVSSVRVQGVFAET
jgi:hypothetical protein